MSRRRWWPLLLLLAFPPALWSTEASTEIIHTFQSPEQLITALRPHLPADTTLSAYQGRLLIRGSPAALRHAKQLLQTLDQPPRQLLVRVRTARSGRSAKTGASVTGDADQATVQIRSHSTDDLDRAEQQIRLLEGGTAQLSTDRLQPVLTLAATGPGSSLISQDPIWLHSGILISPQLTADNRVRLHLTYRQEPTAIGGQPLTQQQLATELVVPLQQWTAIGGDSRNQREAETGLIRYRSDANREQLQFEIRIDPVD